MMRARKSSYNIEKLAHFISDGFSLLQELLYSQQPNTYNSYVAGYPPPLPQQNGMMFGNAACYTDLSCDNSTTE